MLLLRTPEEGSKKMASGLRSQAYEEGDSYASGQETVDRIRQVGRKTGKTRL